MQLNSQNFKGIFIKFGNIPNCLKGCFLCGYHISNNRVQEQKVSLFSIPFLGRDICFSKKDEINQEVYIFLSFPMFLQFSYFMSFAGALTSTVHREVEKLTKFWQNFFKASFLHK